MRKDGDSMRERDRTREGFRRGIEFRKVYRRWCLCMSVVSLEKGPLPLMAVMVMVVHCLLKGKQEWPSW